MNRPFCAASQQGNASQDEMIVHPLFDYSLLEADIAQQAQRAAHRIRQMVKRTLEDLLAVGQELLTMKKDLPYGRFGAWLHAEFGWTERTARHFMAVAERFGAKTEIISELRIDPTAAYLLAAPSAPEEASAAALQRAANGERITVAVAKQILVKLRPKQSPQLPRQPQLPTDKLLGQLLESLESFRRRWNPRQLSLLARQLREFADSLQGE